MSISAVIPLFPRFTALDGIGPYEVLQRVPEIDVTFVGHVRGEVLTSRRASRRRSARARSCSAPPACSKG